jgi:V8-like Glu-specific endopeptidase
MKYSPAACLLALISLCSLCTAQTAPTTHADLPYPHDTGKVENDGKRDDVISSFTVSVPGCKWLRLFFSDVDLPAGTELRVTSWKDGQVQTLDALTAAQWHNSTCYLNGDRVQVDLYAQVGAAPARLVLSEVDAGLAAPSFSICGPTDDRVISLDARVARLLPVGCTGFLIDDCSGCMLTAGHCTDSALPLNVAQFNVPPSNADGSLNHPPPQDQYTVDDLSVQSSGLAPVGEDWAVFGCFSNTVTGLRPIRAQGAGFTLAAAMPPLEAVRVTGFGTDLGNTNQVQQTNWGHLGDTSGTTLGYRVDTTGGNSGSPVAHEWPKGSPLDLLGIHTDSGCTPTVGFNWGTQVTQPALQTALANPMGVCALNWNCGGVPIIPFCSPGNVNSTGAAVFLSGSLTSGSLHMDASGGPSGEFGYFLVSASHFTGAPVSDGLLCLGTPIGRYNPNAGASMNSVGQFGSGGIFQNLAGTSTSGTGFDVPSNLPTPPGGTITTGSSWHFQLWYRDGAGISNFSDGLEVQF